MNRARSIDSRRRRRGWRKSRGRSAFARYRIYGESGEGEMKMKRTKRARIETEKALKRLVAESARNFYAFVCLRREVESMIK